MMRFLLLLCALSASVCHAQSAHQSNTAQPTLTVGHACQSLDPRYSQISQCHNLVYQLYDNLMSIDQQGNIVPGLAKSWQLDAQQKTLTLNLRPDRYWSDGTPLTAQDVIASWSSIIREHLPHTQITHLMGIKGADELASSQTGLLSGLSAPDPYTLRVEFERFDPLFHYRTVNGYLAPIPAHIYQQVGEDWAKPEHIVFSGWYSATQGPEGHYQLQANPYHPDSDQLGIEQITAVYETRYTLKQHDVLKRLPLDNAIGFSRFEGQFDQDIEAVIRKKHWKPLQFSSARTTGLFINVKRVKPSLVKTLKCVIQSDEYLSRSAKRYASVAKRWVTQPNTHLPTLELTHQQGCTEHLAQQRNAPRETLSVQSTSNSNRLSVVAAMLAPYNITLDINEAATPAQDDAAFEQGEYQLLIVRWYVALPDPSGFFVVHRYLKDWTSDAVSKRLNRLLGQANGLTGQARLKAFATAEELILNEGGLIPLNHSPTRYVARQDLCGFVSSQAMIVPFRWLRWCT